jgi:hypothetical protein
MNTICQTAHGKFKIKTDKNINVGGKNFCVNLVLYEKNISLLAKNRPRRM